MINDCKKKKKKSPADGNGFPVAEDALARNRNKALCASCHARMDPLGLSWKISMRWGHVAHTDAKQPINPAGQLIHWRTFATSAN